MALTKTTVGVTNIADLSSTPNATEGLTAAQLQAKFDKTGADLKTYINDTLTAEIDTSNTELTNMTKYITAEATTNGDFKINIINTLTTGMILNIIFPVATSSSSNARLSIDNGTNYKNIYESNDLQLKALNVQSKTLQLRYDGTNFVNIIPRTSILTGKLASNQATVNNTYTLIPVVEYTKYSTKLSVSNGKILIGAGVKNVLVSSFVQYQQPNTTVFVFKTQRDRGGVVSDIGISAYNFAAAENSVIIPTVLIDVQEGDLIQLVYNDINTSNNSIRADGTFLTVQVIE